MSNGDIYIYIYIYFNKERVIVLNFKVSLIDALNFTPS